MAQNNVQCQRGLSMSEFSDRDGSPASAKHPSFLAVNTALVNIRTSLSGTYRAFGFRKYAHR